MFLTKLKIATALLLAIGIAALGAGTLSHGLAQSQKEAAKQVVADDKEKPATKPKDDKDLLQGTWKAVAVEAYGKRLSDEDTNGIHMFAGDKVTIHSKEVNNDGRFELDPKSSPKTIDILHDDPTNTLRGIYKLARDDLTVCIGEPGEDRPTNFTAKEGTRRTLFTFKREPTAKDTDKPQDVKKRDPVADPEFIRRASLEIRGLPPTPAEVQKFLQDKDPDKVNKLIDKWLDEPPHAERLGKLRGLLDKPWREKVAVRLAVREVENALNRLKEDVEDPNKQLKSLEEIEKAVRQMKEKIKPMQDGKTGRLPAGGEWKERAGFQVKGHFEGVYSLAISPKNVKVAGAEVDMAVAGTEVDGTIRIWDASTGAELTALKKHRGSGPLAFAPDGKRLATSGEKTIKLWDPDTGKELQTLGGHLDEILCVAYSPNAKMLASGSKDTSIRLWDVATGKEVRTLQENDSIVCLIFSPNGERLVSGSRDGSVRVWDLTTGKERALLKGHAKSVLCVGFSSNENHVVSVGEDATAKVWDMSTGKEIRDFKAKVDWEVRSAAVFPKAGLLAIGGGEVNRASHFKLWDITTGIEVGDWVRDTRILTSVTFSPSGSLVATACFDGSVRVFETDDGGAGDQQKEIEKQAWQGDDILRDRWSGVGQGKELREAWRSDVLHDRWSETDRPEGQQKLNLDQLVLERLEEGQKEDVDHSIRIRLLERELQQLFNRQLAILPELKKLRASQDRADADFVRHLFLDLLGLPPSKGHVRKFLDDKRFSPVKQAALIDELLSSADSVERWSQAITRPQWEHFFKKGLIDP